ncbi:MAG: dihydrolipoyl dehydrogenase [Kiritimatiellae bacterium]|nr:dihydrolipoyl dehydrogenase [Kiritimatiellia bacterium]
MNSTNRSTHVVVIGAGPGGYPAAFHAADLGLNVMLIDEEVHPGGVCLYRGCIPSKALLHVARVMNDNDEAEQMGVTFAKPKVDIDKMRSWKNSVIQRMTQGLGQLSKIRNVQSIQGRARFADAHHLIVDQGGKEEKISFEYAIIATGSHPTQIPNLPYDSGLILDSASALEIETIPEKLLVIGGGYIGLELGSVYAALGSNVSVVEMLPRLLPGADKDLVTILAKRLKNKFEQIMLETRVAEIKKEKGQLNVKFEGKNGAESEITFDKVLVSVGRKPNAEKLGLENTNIKTDSKGFIPVDLQRRTHEPHIFAIGDVAGEPMLAHKATHEGIVAAEAISGEKTVFEPQAIPAVVFTDPEIAWVGITEAEAKEQELDVKIAKFPWAASGRATTLERNDGLTKLIVDRKTERILGVAITGVSAGDMIAEGALAIEMGANVTDLKLTIHPHPTLSETIMETAEVFFGSSPHFYQKK